MNLNPVAAVRRIAYRLRQSGGAGALVPYTVNWPTNWFQLGFTFPHGSAMTFPAVFAAVDRLSSDVAKIPLRQWRKRGNGRGRDEITSSAALRVLNEPNGYQVGFDVIKSLVTSQLYRGNGYIWGPRNGRDEVMSMHVLSPDGCQPYKAGGEVFYRTAASPLAEIEVDQFLPARDILHHRMTTLSDPLVGVSPLVAAAATVLGASAIQNHSAQFFRNMARPGGYLTTAGKLDPQKAMEIGKRWSDNYGAAVNAGKTAVLEQGLEYKPLTMTAVDAQLIEQMRWSVEDIARVFQIPSFMIGDATKGVYKSAEMLNAIYLSSALDAHFHAIESRLNLFFELTGTNEYLQFDRDALFRTDLDARVGSYAKGVAGGILTPDEARAAAFNINPVEGGDQVYMQQQMVPISMLSEMHQQKLAPPAAPPPPEEPPPPTAEEVGAALSLEMQRRLSTWSA